LDEASAVVSTISSAASLLRRTDRYNSVLDDYFVMFAAQLSLVEDR